MTSRLVALVKRVTELYQAGLRACHYAKEFTPRRICPLGRREKWHMSAHGLPNQPVSQLIVRS
jgi:hypothetical protein